MFGTTITVSFHEDNSGALVLARTLPHHITIRSKYYATKTIWFHEDISKFGIKILKFDTVEYLGGLFTECLTRTTFEYLRKKILSWYISQINRIHPREEVLRLSL